MDLEMYLVCELPLTANLRFSPEVVDRMSVETALEWGEKLQDLRKLFQKG